MLSFILDYNNQNFGNLSNEIENLNIIPPENDQCELKDKEWSEDYEKIDRIQGWSGTYGKVIKASLIILKYLLN